MTLPARDRPGPLGRIAVPAAGQSEFRDYRPNKPPTVMTLFMRTDQAVTLSLYRIDPYGVPRLQQAPISVPITSPTDPDQTVVFDYPVGGLGLRCVVANAGGTVANVAIDAAHGGQGATS